MKMQGRTVAFCSPFVVECTLGRDINDMRINSVSARSQLMKKTHESQTRRGTNKHTLTEDFLGNLSI